MPSARGPYIYLFPGIAQIEKREAKFVQLRLSPVFKLANYCPKLGFGAELRTDARQTNERGTQESQGRAAIRHGGDRQS